MKVGSRKREKAKSGSASIGPGPAGARPEVTAKAGDMPSEEFRRHGYRLIDWIADYLSHPERFAVLPQVEPGQFRAVLPDVAPETGEDFTGVLDDWERLLLPGVTHWNHPGFFAYFAITGSGPGILGELLSQALNINAMLWRTGPAATELEEVVLGWLRKMVGLPEEFFGVLTEGASVSSMRAMAAAREALGLGFCQRGLAGGPRLRLYTSEQSHSSIEKGAIVLGFGQEGVRKIPVDSEFRMRPESLGAAIQENRAAGWLPFCVVATVGTTSTTSVDPLPAIADICAAQNLWLHVDAAYAGPAAIVPEYRPLLAGWERADSVVLNVAVHPRRVQRLLLPPSGDPAGCLQPGPGILAHAGGCVRQQLHGLRRAARPAGSAPSNSGLSCATSARKGFGSACANTSTWHRNSPSGWMKNRASST